MDTLLNSVLELPNGARFYRVDLHNHTPFDEIFHCGGLSVNSEEEKMAFAEAYTRFLKEEQGIEIVGVTEHNDVSWLTYIQEAAKKIDLTVFPGVELGSKTGKRQVHFLALFDPETQAKEIDHVISSFGLVPEDRFSPNGHPKSTDCGAEELMEKIVEKGGIPIAAHATSTNGLFHEVQGDTRGQVYSHNRLIAVEIPGRREDLSDFEKALVDGEKDYYNNKDIACLNNSDGRSINEAHPDGRPAIGSRFTHVKLSDISVEALAKAYRGYDSRIRLEGEFRQEKYPRLLGLVIENGFLSQKPMDEQAKPFMIHFNPNLNAIIGGRGAGKSALLEAIRYVFDLDPRADDSIDQHEEIIKNTLSPDARITSFYQLADGTQYKITRVKGHPPKVYNARTGVEKAVKPHQIFNPGNPIEVYGQKEIFEISKDATFQLNLLDTYAIEKLKEIQQREQKLLRWLSSNADDILRLQDEVARAEQKVQELEGVRLELERMEKHETADQLEKKKKAEREKELLTRASDGVEALLDSLTRFQTKQEKLKDLLPNSPQILEENLPHKNTLTNEIALLERIDNTFSQELNLLYQHIESIWAEGEKGREQFRKAYKKIQQDYEDMLNTFGEDFSAERYFAQRAKLQALEGIRREMEQRKKRLKELTEERKKRLNTLRQIRRTQIFRLRKKTAQRLTHQIQRQKPDDNHSENDEGAVRVEITREGYREAYEEKLAELFTGYGIRRDVLSQIVNSKLPLCKGTIEERNFYPDPIHLVQAIRCERIISSEENSLLETIYGISEAYRSRLASIDDEILYRLESYRVPDKPDICLKVGKQYRSLTPAEGEPGLSTGQKCTAILSLILVERDVPLIIDQPEDDLDNEFIFREIVQTLKQEKERRQFIIATHNANIPVSGDAELIAVLQADQNHGWLEVEPGSIDDPEIRKPVEDILEGGEEAFRIRSRKYEKWSS